VETMALRDEVSAEMRDRLSNNRHGRLTVDQWKDMVTEPIIILLMLTIAAVLVFGPRLLVLTARGMVFLVLAVLLMLVVPLAFRAWRYARAPVHFERLYASDNPASAVLFWRPQVLYTENGTEIRFRRRLAPITQLRPNRAYCVYYLRDAGQYVLLSMAPADHPDAERWQPSQTFHERFARRTGRSA
jgi:hypothetical protein